MKVNGFPVISVIINLPVPTTWKDIKKRNIAPFDTIVICVTWWPRARRV